MSVKLGIFAVPDATEFETTIQTILAADGSGLDLVGIQDHPYQRRFFDTWTLLSYAASRPSTCACFLTSSTCRFACQRCSPSRPRRWTCSVEAGSSLASGRDRSGRRSRR
jgi:hypothetical protein